jgi:hypothetical protein
MIEYYCFIKRGKRPEETQRNSPCPLPHDILQYLRTLSARYIERQHDQALYAHMNNKRKRKKKDSMNNNNIYYYTLILIIEQ